MTDRDHWFEDLADHLGYGLRPVCAHQGHGAGGRPHRRCARACSRASGCSTSVAAPVATPIELARRGIEVHGIDISQRFIDIARNAAAPPLATFERADARSMAFEAEFDAVICLCQGAFGMMTADGDDDAVVAGMARALEAGGRLALSAFNAYFAVKYHDAATFDAATGVSHEVTEIRSETGEARSVDLWTGCYTPRELRLLLGRHGFDVDRSAASSPVPTARRRPRPSHPSTSSSPTAPDPAPQPPAPPRNSEPRSR